jgi:hypothetical protein
VLMRRKKSIKFVLGVEYLRRSGEVEGTVHCLFESSHHIS